MKKAWFRKNAYNGDPGLISPFSKSSSSIRRSAIISAGCLGSNIMVLFLLTDAYYCHHI